MDERNFETYFNQKLTPYYESGPLLSWDQTDDGDLLGVGAHFRYQPASASGPLVGPAGARSVLQELASVAPVSASI